MRALACVSHKVMNSLINPTAATNKRRWPFRDQGSGFVYSMMYASQTLRYTAVYKKKMIPILTDGLLIVGYMLNSEILLTMGGQRSAGEGRKLL